MAIDYTIIESSPIHIGNEPTYFSTEGFGGKATFHFQKYESKPFDCPGMIRAEPALLMFMSNDVHSRHNVVKIKNSTVGEVELSERIPQNVTGGDQSDAWMGNTLVVDGNILLPASNTLEIRSRNLDGDETGNLDDFRIDNIVVFYKSANRAG